MRKALNENPMAQIAVIAIAGVIFAIILFTMVLKGDSTDSAGSGDGLAMADPSVAPENAGTSSATGAAPATGDAAATTAPADGTVAPADGTAAPDAAAPVTPAVPDTAPTTPPPGGSVSEGLLPSKGLPKDVLVAFAKNKTIALLVINPKATADKKLKAYTEALRKRNDVEVFVVKVKDISRYARITAGVNVNQTPALVIIRPRKLTRSVPTATVSYGFRSAKSVNQAVDDALYKGKQVPSYP